MGDAITLETLYVSFQDAFADLREQVVTLREHSAKRNGYVEAINQKLAELQTTASNRPCEAHALRLLALEKDEGQDKKRWEKVTDTMWEIGKYVVTCLIGAVLAYIVYKLTGVTP
ncbi:MAG: hypothetical protein GY832_11215 [Chloroflexi bacterium]|nr:hypothetical protein [Chloroflexota bacterium]